MNFKYKENPFKYDIEQIKPNKKEDKINLILEFCREPKSVKEIMKYIGLKHRSTVLVSLICL